jgi:hypothetical protein
MNIYEPVFSNVTPKPTVETYIRITTKQELVAHLGGSVSDEEYLSAIYSGPVDIWSDNETSELRNL